MPPLAAWPWRQIIFWGMLALIAIGLAIGHGQRVVYMLQLILAPPAHRGEYRTDPWQWKAPANVAPPPSAVKSAPLLSIAEVEPLFSTAEVAHLPSAPPAPVQPPEANLLPHPREPLPTVPVGLAKSNELEARAALKRLTGREFKSIRPPWLTNARTGRRLECDCYNDELRLCVEVNGKQHYEWPNSFHATQAQFEAQVYRDQLKQELLRTHGDTLVVVPYWIKRKDTQSYLARELQQHGLDTAL